MVGVDHPPRPTVRPTPAKRVSVQLVLADHPNLNINSVTVQLVLAVLIEGDDEVQAKDLSLREMSISTNVGPGYGGVAE